MAEEFKFDHDVRLYVEYEDAFSPQVVMENGNPEAGMEGKLPFRGSSSVRISRAVFTITG